MYGVCSVVQWRCAHSNMVHYNCCTLRRPIGTDATCRWNQEPHRSSASGLPGCAGISRSLSLSPTQSAWSASKLPRDHLPLLAHLGVSSGSWNLTPLPHHPALGRPTGQRSLAPPQILSPKARGPAPANGSAPGPGSPLGLRPRGVAPIEAKFFASSAESVGA